MKLWMFFLAPLFFFGCSAHYPTLLVDTALKSPFSFWKHSRIFTDVGDGYCELKDVVEYELPLGFIGEFFDFVVKRTLDKMFKHRYNVTKNTIEG